MRNGKQHLSPAERRVLAILLDKDSAAEMSVEIAAITGFSVDSVDHIMARIYHFYGVRSARGLFRLLDLIITELSREEVRLSD